MIVGLTGGIGSGKTVVSKLFALFGAKVFNSDENAKLQYFKPNVKAKVIELLGTGSYHSNGTIDRKYISEKVFSDTMLLQKLNSIIHPEVANEFKLFAQENSNKLIIKESALLFETGIYKELDQTILVTSPLELRIKRIMQRDGSQENEVMNRIKSQMSDEEKLKLTSLVIKNNEKDLLIPQTLNIYQQLNA